VKVFRSFFLSAIFAVGLMAGGKYYYQCVPVNVFNTETEQVFEIPKEKQESSAKLVFTFNTEKDELVDMFGNVFKRIDQLEGYDFYENENIFIYINKSKIKNKHQDILVYAPSKSKKFVFQSKCVVYPFY
jgi:hypothetical protein